MSLHDNTKQIFADTLTNLLKTIPFNRITVQRITDTCGASRQSFYYHFKDKYDLVTWIYKTDSDRIVNTSPTASWWEIISAILEVMEQKRSFYVKIFREEGQNNLIDYLVAYDVELYTRILRERKEVIRLDESLLFSIEYHSYACVHMTKRWIMQYPHKAPKKYAQELLSVMPSNIRELLV
ncbi:TetR/AcrR family transcriptional regulator C-terminal domain-containing protein [Neobacillus niacini]|uniref:TetR/AcrR family transcriptional regulator C-terminal domain-containing protein n=1 Tax=Neobacillus niacini TaxID=86668 RepID=UPI002FFF0781